MIRRLPNSPDEDAGGRALPPSVLELSALMAIVLMLAFPDLFDTDDRYRLVNAAGASGYFAILSYGAMRMLHLSRSSVMSPLFVFRVACAIYFGLGSLSPLFVNDVTLDYMMNVGTYSGLDLVKFNLVVVLSTFITLLAARLTCRVQVSRPATGIQKIRTQSAVTIGVAMYLVGAGVQYGVVAPGQLSWTSLILPYALGQFANFTYVGIFLLTLTALHRRPVLATIPLLLALLDASVGALLFSKTAILLPVLAFGMAWMIRAKRLVDGILPALVVVLAFLLSAPLVGYGRSQLGATDGLSVEAPIAERIDILRRYLVEGERLKESDVQYAWVRLSYVNWGVRVIQLHDEGKPGRTLENGWAVVVPRVIWPDKPDLSAAGTSLYSSVTGFSGVSVSPGLFAEAYWNFGWLGPPLLMAPLGLLLGYLSRLSAFVMREGVWLMLPVVFLGVRLGSRVDGSYVMDVLGAGVIALCLAVLLSIGDSMLRVRPVHQMRKQATA